MPRSSLSKARAQLHVLHGDGPWCRRPGRAIRSATTHSVRWPRVEEQRRTGLPLVLMRPTTPLPSWSSCEPQWELQYSIHRHRRRKRGAMPISVSSRSQSELSPSLAPFPPGTLSPVRHQGLRTCHRTGTEGPSATSSRSPTRPSGVTGPVRRHRRARHFRRGRAEGHPVLLTVTLEVSYVNVELQGLAWVVGAPDELLISGTHVRGVARVRSGARHQRSARAAVRRPAMALRSLKRHDAGLRLSRSSSHSRSDDEQYFGRTDRVPDTQAIGCESLLHAQALAGSGR